MQEDGNNYMYLKVPYKCHEVPFLTFCAFFFSLGVDIGHQKHSEYLKPAKRAVQTPFKYLCLNKWLCLPVPLEFPCQVDL